MLWLLDLIPTPILIVIWLIIAALLWYLLGSKFGKFGAALFVLLTIYKTIRDQGRRDEEAKRKQAQLDAILAADRVRDHQRRDNLSGGLRSNDGYERKS